MDANRISCTKMLSVIFAVFFFSGASMAAESSWSSGILFHEDNFVENIWTRCDVYPMNCRDTQTTSPMYGFIQTDVDAFAVYFDLYYILDLLYTPLSWFDFKFTEMCCLLVFIMTAVSVWRQKCETAKLQSDVKLLSHQLNCTSLTLQQVIPELQECKRKLKSSQRLTKRLETLTSIADMNAEEIKRLSRELKTWKWKSNWTIVQKALDEKKNVDEQKTPINPEDFLKKSQFDKFIQWNGGANHHIRTMLSTQHWWIYDLYSKVNAIDYQLELRPRDSPV